MFITTAAAPAAHAALDELRDATEAIWRAEVAAVQAMLTLADSYRVDEWAAQDAAAAIGDRLPADSVTGNLRWLCLEVGAALGLSPASAGSRVAQALALRDRHPQLWLAVQAGRLRLWQTREVITRCAHLDDDACQRVDAQVSRWCGVLPWARLLKAVDAAVLAADPDLARERREVESRQRFVHVGGISDGHVDVAGRLSAGDGVALDQALDGIADAYLDPASPWHRCVASVQQARSMALGELARTALGQDTLLVAGDQPCQPQVTATMSCTPAQQTIPAWAGAPARPESLRDVLRDEAVALHHHHALIGAFEPTAASDQADALPVPFANPARPRPPVAPRGWALPPITRRATLVVHISAGSLGEAPGSTSADASAPDSADASAPDSADASAPDDGRDGSALARVEGWGPILQDQLNELLRGMKVTIRPIVHAEGHIPPADCYEIPDRHRFVVSQRNPVDVFPYATRPAARCDLDHTVPWPRGDTQPDNLGPLSRTVHVAKTLKLWRLEQPAPGVFVWESPLHQRYLVTAHGSLPLPESVSVRST